MIMPSIGGQRVTKKGHYLLFILSLFVVQNGRLLLTQHAYKVQPLPANLLGRTDRPPLQIIPAIINIVGIINFLTTSLLLVLFVCIDHWVCGAQVDL